jgi:addiction module HigA family antidote
MEVKTAARIAALELVANRREPATHPGPAILSYFLAPLGHDAASFAPLIGMPVQRLERMLTGNETIDVESAIRLARSLQINPKLLVERQARYDFAQLRRDEALEAIPLLKDDGRVAFPESGFIRGRLAGLRDTSAYGGVRDETLGFFSDAGQGETPPEKAYPLDFGAKLRIYDEAAETAVWTGVVLRNLEGRILLPYVRPSVWIEWFASRRRADFIPPPQHEA